MADPGPSHAGDNPDTPAPPAPAFNFTAIWNVTELEFRTLSEFSSLTLTDMQSWDTARMQKNVDLIQAACKSLHIKANQFTTDPADQIQQYQYENAQMTQDLDHAQDQIQNLEKELTESRHQVTNLSNTVSQLSVLLTTRPDPAPAPAPVPAPTPAPPLESITVTPLGTTINNQRIQKISDPAKFSGKREDLDPFLLALQNKIHGNASLFPTEDIKMRYTFGLLERTAQDHIAPHMNKLTGAFDFVDFEAFLQVLQTAFADPDARGTAVAKINQIRMNNRDFSTYYAEFQKYAPHTGYENLVLRDLLKAGLSQELQQLLLPQPALPARLTEFATLCQSLDKNLQQNSQLRSRFAPRPAPRLAPAKPNPITPTSPAPIARPIHPTSGGSGHYGAAPMDLSGVRQKLTPEEKQRRIEEGLCLYCGGLGHLAFQCPENKRPRSRFPQPVRAHEFIFTPETSQEAPSGNV